jgi:hypothetical protein
MKHFQVPSDIQLRNPQTGESIKGADGKSITKKFLVHAFDCWLNDSRAGEGPVNLRRWMKVVEIFKAATTWISLEDQDYSILRTIVESPKNTYANPLIDMQLLPFSEAVLGAVDEKPVALRAVEN